MEGVENVRERQDELGEDEEIQEELGEDEEI